jgi:hypothetical protein
MDSDRLAKMEEAMRDRKRLLLVLTAFLLILSLGACEIAATPTPVIPFPTIPTVATPEPTPPPTVPTITPTSPPGCTDRATFDSDVTVPPGTVFLPGQSFVKTWRLRNTGTCTWTTDYTLIFYTGDRMAGPALVPFPVAVPEGGIVDLSVALVAPAGAGTYEGRWLLRSADGVAFGIVESADGSFGVRIVVETTTDTVTPPAPTVPPQPTVEPTPGITPIITDWQGEYFDNPDVSGTPVLVRNDESIDFDWGLDAPAEGVPPDAFSVRWTQDLDLEAGPYRFRALVDDGVRLWVDEQLVIDAWVNGAQREVVGDWTVTSGSHTLRVEYYDSVRHAFIRVGWDSLSSVYPDWEGQYWTNADLSGVPALVQNEGAIDFNWGEGSLAAGMPIDNFSARWMRVVSFDDATYQFNVIVDDGVRIWVDADLIVDSWQDGGFREITAEVPVTAGAHLVRVEYYERGGEAQVRVWWEKQ